MKAVKVNFHKGDKGYWYLVPKDLDEFVQLGTHVVVSSPYTGYTVATVETINEEALSTQAREYIVDVVDDKNYQQRKKDEARKAVLKKQLEKKANELMELKKYEILAGDEEGKKLLEELKSLTGD